MTANLRQSEFFKVLQVRYDLRTANNARFNYLHTGNGLNFLEGVEIPELLILSIEQTIEDIETLEALEDPDPTSFAIFGEFRGPKLKKLNKHIQTLKGQ